MSSIGQRKKRYCIIAVSWAILLAVGAVQPHRLMVKVLPREWLFDAAHLVAYTLFGYLLCLWFRFQRTLGEVRLTPVMAAVFALVGALFWSAVTEWLQMFRWDRYTEWKDFLFNTLGASLGVLFFMLHVRYRRKKTPRPKT